MGDEPQPSTSKPAGGQSDAIQKNHSNSDIDKMDEQQSGSETSMTNSHTDTSHTEMVQERGMKAQKGSKERKSKDQKKRRKPTGRVVKRTRRVEVKRRVARRSKRLKEAKKREQHFSASTMFTRLSAESPDQGCPYCGHRCCSRRYFEAKHERDRERKPRNFSKRDKLRLKCMATQTPVQCFIGTESIQVGSRCMMLSPLCINTNASPPEPVAEKLRSCEISPQMIYEALKRLTMFRQHVDSTAILEYIMKSYPVGRGEELLEELEEKLRIAVIVGIVTRTPEDLWCLTCALMQRRLTKNHVSLFWKLYGDTMKPVTRDPNYPMKIPDDEIL